VPRRDWDPTALTLDEVYALLGNVVVPRPIAWVSTRSVDGVDNLAPHSYFTIASVRPAIVQFTSVGTKDTLRNALATGEFVVALSPEPLVEQINATAIGYPPEVSEFDAVGLAREPSRLVAPPRVAASPVNLECRVVDTKTFGDATVVFGEVVWASVDEAVLAEDGWPQPELMRPMSRLGRDDWATLGTVTAHVRAPYPGPAAGPAVG
jgi:flavin reductase (DIM6/NTAB) family NADH-FMN oxidoreductase RutF